MFSSANLDNHEKVIFVNDNATGLQAIIAIHNTKLGPAIGGLRFWPYQNESEALSDVLRLSRGMSYKCAISKITFGGGKTVVIQGDGFKKTPELLSKIGQAIGDLNGQYITGEDVGSTVEDMLSLRKETDHVMGAPLDKGGSGDPSSMTALGCFVGIKASVKNRFNTDDLKGVRVAVQGLGNVGWNLCTRLHTAGAILFVCDISESISKRCAEAFGATVIDINNIYDADVDVFSPCAMGGVINDKTISRLKAKVIAGGANNQLATEAHGKYLQEQGVLYAPDYVINAGGVIQFAFERQAYNENKPFNPDLIKPKVVSIYNTLEDVFRMAEEEKISTSLAADRIAEERMA